MKYTCLSLARIPLWIMPLADVFKAKILLLCSRLSAKHNITVSRVQGVNT